MQREVCTAPDYKAMYFELFRASVQAAQLLQDAQKRAEVRCKHERSLKILLIKVRFGVYPLALKIRFTR